MIITMAYGGNIGDPWNNWQPNNPFLEMLAAIDGPEGAAGGQDGGHHHRHSGNVKLPDFWPEAPGIWFARAELRFEVSGVMSERERFAHAVNALSQDATRLVTDLITTPPADRPYSVLKERLMVAHQLSAVQKATKVLAMPPLGDRRPSQMLADLLEFCPTGEENTAFFRSAFMQGLPAELQVLLDGTEEGDLKQLAQKADKLWSIRRPADTAVSAVTQQEEEDSEWVAAVQHNKKKEWGEKKHNTGGSSGSGGRTSGSHGGNGGRRPPKMFTVCYRHMKFGAAAYKCDDPASCTYKGN